MKIIRIKNDVKIGQEISAKNIETVEVGAYNMPSEVLKKSEDVVGKYATMEMLKGEYVLPTKISDTPASENAYLYSLFNAGTVDSTFYMDALQLEPSEYKIIQYPHRGMCLYKCGNRGTAFALLRRPTKRNCLERRAEGKFFLHYMVGCGILFIKEEGLL